MKVASHQWSVNKNVLVLAFSSVLLALCHPAAAQEQKKHPRVAYLSASSSSLNAARDQALRQGLREVGYVDGKNITIDWRYAEGKPDRLPTLAAELVRLNTDIIITGGPTTTRAAKKATSLVPIIMTQDTDPVGNGFVTTLARPGGNITGLSTLAPEISGKQLELLKEVVPRLSRVAVLGTSTNPGNAQALEQTELAAAAFGVKLQYLDVLGVRDIERAFEAVSKNRANAVLALGSPVLNSHRAQLIHLAVKNRLPAICSWPEIVDEGGLMTYGVSYNYLHRRAALYVDKILKGAKPADLPVEQPSKFEFVVNLITAKQMGLTIPPSVLARADRVIR